MEFKKSMIIIILAIFLLSIASVCASDANDTAIASENNLEIDQTTDDVIGVGDDINLASSEENEILSADEQTFARLNATINGNTGKDIYLNSDYKYSNGDDSFKNGIVINRDVNIYGNGSVIDGNNEARIFQINGGNVVFYNITFINGNAGKEWEDTGGAINGNCKAINCTFTDNHASRGGAMYKGSAVNCSFSGNTAEYGGAMFKGSAVNCSFSHNDSPLSGGAMKGGSAVNCSFSGNTATFSGGAMDGGSAVNCSFSGNTAEDGGAMNGGYKMNCTGQDSGDYEYTQDLVLHWDANNFITVYGSADKLPISLMNQEDTLIDFINYDVVIYKDGSKVKTYHCLSNDKLSIDLLPGVYTAELIVTYPGIDKPEPKNITLTVKYASFTDLNKAINGNTKDTITLDKNYSFNSTFDSAFTDGIVINRKVTINGNGHTIDAKGKSRIFYIEADDATIENLTIINANVTGDGGAIYFAKSGSAINCNFTGNNANYDGGAIYFVGSGNVTNCNFTGNNATHSGTVYFNKQGNVTNCNFTGNTAHYGGAVNFNKQGNVTNCNFTGNTANWGGAIRMDTGTVSNCNFTNNTANLGGAIRANSGTMLNCNFTNNTASDYGGAVYINLQGNVTNCNFTNNSASDYGGAIRMNTGNVTNCNFTNNKATSGNGGAVYFYDCDGSVTNCSFTGNNACDGNTGGAVYFNNYDGSVTNCNFVNNSAKYGGAVYFLNNGNVTNCNFTNNSASKGGAIYFDENSNGNVTNCNFINNSASNGGAIYFARNSNGNVTNCNFTDNIASSDGSAIDFEGSGTVTNCNFTGNEATGSDSCGGAIYMYSGNITDCNFTNNSASGTGGAIDFEGSFTAENCNFVNNTSSDGGAIFCDDSGTVTNCNFTNNTAIYGGAVFFLDTGNVTNCNFTGNNAVGSAIYFWSDSATKTVSNSYFLNNKANAETLDVVKNENNITITFTGQNNLLNAIYSIDDTEVTFNNVTYWGANGITTISSTKSGSNKEAGQNMTLVVVVNDELVFNEVKVTDENGTIVLDISAGENYYISVRHDEDSYYTAAEKTISNMRFYINVTGTETTNKTVNITAKSNIYNEVMPGNLLFIVPNSNPINANYAENGTWWAVHTFDEYGEYNITAFHSKLNNVTVNNGTVTINKANSTITLNDVVLNYGDSVNLTVIAKGASGISAKIDNKDVNVTGYTIHISGLNAGNHSLTVTAIPDEDHISTNKTVNIAVAKINSNLTVNNITFDYNATGYANVSYHGAVGIDTTVIGQPNATVNIENNTITISGLNTGNYTLSVTTIPDANHNSVSKNVTITVNKLKTELSANAVTATYNINKNLVITLKDANGNALSGVNLTVKIVNTRTYTTDKNGQIKINVAKLAPKTYTAKITFNGNDNYNKTSKDVKVKVKKAKAKIIAKKKTYKAKKKVKKYKITLKNNKGKPIKKAKITLKIKKKTYKAKTNKKGKATFKIKKLTKKGKYKATIKYKGNKYYKKTTKKVKIKIK